MAESLPSPPISRASTPGSQTATVSSDELTVRLDRLLEKYLELLDQYSILQEELSKTFSKGFLSLANAQRTANLGAARRYGQEGYDGRTKALRRVNIQAENCSKIGESKHTAATNDPMNHEQRYICSVSLHEPGSTTRNKSSTLENHIPEAGNTEGDIQDSSRTDNQESRQYDKKPDPAYRDPATWFGILVPQQLRQTQKCFTTAIETAVPSLVNIKSSMLLLEQDIWQVRKSLGIEEQYSLVQDSASEPVPDPIKEIDRLLAKAKVSG